MHIRFFLIYTLMSLFFMSFDISLHKAALGTKEFIAKGSNVERCKHCFLASFFCICSQKIIAPSRTEFCLLTHHIEQFKPTNTGRLIGQILPCTHYFTWFRTEPDSHFLSSTTTPSRNITTRLVWAATSGSWVTTIKVVPFSLFR